MLALTLLATPAQAFVYVGNPPLTLQVVRDEADLTSGSVDLLGVRVHKCAGGYDDYEIDEVVDPTEPFTVTIAGGNLCAVTVGWSSDLTVTNGSFVLRYEYAYTTVMLSGAAYDEEPLVPFVVDSGTFSGSKPDLRITID
ncbi:MAG: hypothetical protein H6735_22890 [Alphaproteobacteria bacterium]|nr:hypothetical protein [Alphaproteobacteria bacterium]